jgi:hypothetical protein
MRETRSSGSVRGASGDGRPYRERFPDVHIDLVDAVSNELERQVAHGLLDVTFVHPPLAEPTNAHCYAVCSTVGRRAPQRSSARAEHENL